MLIKIVRDEEVSFNTWDNSDAVDKDDTRYLSMGENPIDLARCDVDTFDVDLILALVITLLISANAEEEEPLGHMASRSEVMSKRDLLFRF